MVYYDGLATNTINLDVLRSNITIIPQTVSTCIPTSTPDELTFTIAGIVKW
jgi:hypothetical protein